MKHTLAYLKKCEASILASPPCDISCAAKELEEIQDEIKRIEEVMNKAINDIQKERGSVYGEFPFQCECVGSIIKALMECSLNNGKEANDEHVGAFAYMAIKLARYAVSPSHVDTLVDLESYANLIKKMELQDE